MARSFYPLEDFAPTPSQVSLLPFRFMRLHGKELLVNEAGEFLFVPTRNNCRFGRWTGRRAVNFVQGSKGKALSL